MTKQITIIQPMTELESVPPGARLMCNIVDSKEECAGGAIYQYGSQIVIKLEREMVVYEMTFVQLWQAVKSAHHAPK